MKSYISIDLEQPHQQVDVPIQSFKKIYRVHKKSQIKYWLYGTIGFVLLVMFIPWTQNIRAKGNITTLRQEQRVQEVNTVIAGKILKWYIKEGDYVKAGDTILQLGEVKVDYFDPQLINRTQDQINAKQQSIEGYENKAATAITQINALKEGQALKLQSLDNKLKQQQLKVESDSTDLIAIKNELTIAKRQFDAAKIMLDSGAMSLIDFEKRKISNQNSQAKRISAENKYLQSRQELISLRIEKNSAVQDYTDKISKAEGERYASLSNVASTKAEVSKLQNVYANYDARNQYYFILAPQNGQITKVKKEGINEMVKEGEILCEIVPTSNKLAVELFIEPMNIPLVAIGQKVRFVFDGFPAIVFSGWPKNSFGTFGGVVVAVETSISSNGKFRVLVAEDSAEHHHWPDNIKLGGGAQGIALLKNVPIYYELWRNINGFPPEYYKPKDYGAKTAEKKKE